MSQAKLATLVAAAFAVAPAAAQDAPAPAAPASAASAAAETITITGARAVRTSKGATGLTLAIKDTPQSISVVGQDQMRSFGADNLNDALRLAPGINVEEWETNRTNYTARGFDIVNTQIDGVGMPNDWGIVTGAYDSYGYEKVEVIRGANGQLTGVGNAAGTINYVRKRPTNEAQGELGLSVGSWNKRRVEFDYSAPFTDDRRWAGRFVAAYEKSDSWLRLQHDDRLFVYGVVDGQIGEHGTLTIGWSYQDANTKGNLWGGLPFAQSDGTQAEFPRDATTSQEWTRWDTANHNAFVEYTHDLGGDWVLKASYNWRRYGEKSRLFYAWAETGIDPDTHEGVLGYPGNYGGRVLAHLGEISVSGHFNAFGREHEAVLGIAASRSGTRSDTADPDPYEVEMPAFPYPGDAVPEPTWGPTYIYESSGQWLHRAYGAARLTLAERWHAIVGFNWTHYRNAGQSIYDEELYGLSQSKFSPYAGLTWDITERVLAYASYSDIYQPQQQQDIDFHPLKPTEGVNYEVGVKADWLDRRLLTTLALFSAKQRGLATLAGYTLPDFVYYYEGVDVNSKGVELEVTGKLGNDVDVVFGLTALRLTGADGTASYPWMPRRTAKLALRGRVPALPQLRLGVSGRWQSEVHNRDDADVTDIRQGPYAVLDAFAEWQFNDRLSLQFNAENLTDRKYIGSLYYVGYYGAPRNYALGLHWKL